MYYIKTNPEEKITKKEKNSYNRAGRFFARIFTFKKRIEISGLENRVAEGPNIIIGTHAYEWDDVAAVFRAYSKRKRKKSKRRQVFFTINRNLSEKEALTSLVEENAIRRWGPKFFDGRLLGVKRKKILPYFVKYVTSKIKNIGFIPIDLEKGGRNLRAMGMIKKYLVDYKRAVVFLQFYPFKEREKGISLYAIRPATLKTALSLYEKYKVDPAITLFTVKKQGRVLKIGIAPPEYISNYHVRDNPELTLENLKSNLEKKLEETHQNL